MLAPLHYKLSQNRMVYYSLGRAILVPWLAWCAIQGARSTFVDDILAMFLSSMLGISNGIMGSVPMIVAPGKVPHEYRELTGEGLN